MEWRLQVDLDEVVWLCSCNDKEDEQIPLDLDDDDSGADQPADNRGLYSAFLACFPGFQYHEIPTDPP